MKGNLVFMRGEERVAMVVGFVVLDFACGPSFLGLLFSNVKEFASRCRQGKVLPCRQGLQLLCVWLCF